MWKNGRNSKVGIRRGKYNFVMSNNLHCTSVVGDVCS